MADSDGRTENSSTSSIAVTLTPEQWAQVLGMLEQGTQVILAQLATQQGGLQAVTNLSNIASGLIAEIKEQTK
jgi:hypothetical protein